MATKAVETDVEKVKRLGSVRVNKLIKAIQGLGNISRYKPSAKQTEAVFTVLQSELNAAKTRWTSQKADAASSFNMPA